jgi:exonuclease III
MEAKLHYPFSIPGYNNIPFNKRWKHQVLVAKNLSYSVFDNSEHGVIIDLDDVKVGCFYVHPSVSKLHQTWADIAAMVTGIRTEILLCGDWNVNIAHPENARFTKHITDNSTMSIFSPGLTFDHSRGSSALDYAFATANAAVSVNVDYSLVESDHYPVSIKFKSATAPKKYINHLAIKSDPQRRKNFDTLLQ